MRYPTHIAGNRPDFVMTDVPDIVDVVVGTPLGPSDHYIVSCVIRVEKYVPEYNVGSTIFLTRVHSEVRSFTWSSSLESDEPLVADPLVIGRYVATILHNRSEDKQYGLILAADIL